MFAMQNVRIVLHEETLKHHFEKLNINGIYNKNKQFGGQIWPCRMEWVNEMINPLVPKKYICTSI